jgi:hypothetical protein
MQCQGHGQRFVLERNRMVYLDTHAFVSEETFQVFLSALEELERRCHVRIVCSYLDKGSERNISSQLVFDAVRRLPACL